MRAGETATTFLFSDIEGSTRLWEHYPEAMNRALVRHDMIMRHAIEGHGGSVFKTVGDQFCATFDSPSAGIAAAVASQVGLQAQKWEDTVQIRVRMALHYGTAQARANDFFGTTVNKVARILSTAHGGQIIVSGEVASRAEEQLPPDIRLSDLGQHRLKDLQQPEQIFQVAHHQLGLEFPPLRSINPEVNNLPIQLTSFIGRENELAEVTALLAENRLTTLIGSGGSGKTRLALQVAANAVDEFPEGVWLVELAPITDRHLVAPAVASALGLRESRERPVIRDLVDFCRTRKMVLLLDNCEHLIQETAEVVSALLAGSPGLKVMATSREPLSITGERTWRVPSMKPLPPDQNISKVQLVQELAANDAARLFVERATVIAPGFELTEANAEAVAQVCYQLDGIPLAIELAAARVKVLPVDQIASRLDDRFRLLTGGSRTSLPRQQTLRALIDWSYDLLLDNEKALLRHLSVFAGNATLEAIEAIGANEEIEQWEVLDLLSLLVDKSLVTVDEIDTGVRYGMLQTVRQYGREKLVESGKAKEVFDRYFMYYAESAKEASTHLQGPQQAHFLQLLSADRHNLRAALEHGRSSDPVSALGMGADMWRYWLVHSRFTEGREVLASLLAANEGHRSSADFVRALQGAGVLALTQNDYTAASDYLQQCLALSSEHGFPEYQSAALNSLGNLSWRQGDYPMAKELYTKSLELEKSRSNDTGVARALISLGNVATQQADFSEARELYQQALKLSRDIKNSAWEAAVLHNLGDVEWSQANHDEAWTYYNDSLIVREALGDRLGKSRVTSKLGNIALLRGNIDEARRFFEDSLRETRELGDHLWEAIALANLGDLALAQNDVAEALARHLEAFDLRVELDDRWGLANSLTNLGNVTAAGARFSEASQLYGASTKLREEIGAPLPPVERLNYDAGLEACRNALGEDGCDAAMALGHALNLSSARALAAGAESKQTAQA